MKTAIQYIGVFGSWAMAIMYLVPLFESSPLLAFGIGAVVSLGMTWHLMEQAQCMHDAKRDRERLDVYREHHGHQ